ncbi:urease accessory protein UreE [Arsenicitalea aurantiaca]|uniref:Urease accessory protein UreE n=1 Tax=Arsenicitalea aurantiaca TaxID=1783274 RepID=A0A433XM64_9HYPH|nr:urease accessory protein UreE [Arsenicitalea aurantiaca]RUT35078.1 urease accessory protein UreE [Arsenicitalea aurantiaca]
MLRATAHRPSLAEAKAFDHVRLAHDERRLRRKLLTLAGGGEVLVDLPTTITLPHGGALVLEDGRLIEVIAAEEPLYRVTGRDLRHVMQLCWHLGNRHLRAELQADGPDGPAILILRDRVIGDMLAGLGATVSEISGPFVPEEGAYHSHGDHGHALLNR